MDCFTISWPFSEDLILLDPKKYVSNSTLCNMIAKTTLLSGSEFLLPIASCLSIPFSWTNPWLWDEEVSNDKAVGLSAPWAYSWTLSQIFRFPYSMRDMVSHSTSLKPFVFMRLSNSFAVNVRFTCNGPSSFWSKYHASQPVWKRSSL
jgi:hypothetical protein